MLALILWTIVLIAQSVAFMLARRAGNSGSYLYAAGASTLSHGVWFLAFYFTFDYLDQIHSGMAWYFAVAIGLYYAAVNMGGSLLGMWIARTFFEKGKRQIGHYDQKQAALESLEDSVILHERRLDALHEQMQLVAQVFDVSRTQSHSPRALRDRVEEILTPEEE